MKGRVSSSKEKFELEVKYDYHQISGQQILERVGKAMVGLGYTHINRFPERVRRVRGHWEQDAGMFLELAKEENPRGMENQNPARMGQSLEKGRKFVKRSNEVG